MFKGKTDILSLLVAYFCILNLCFNMSFVEECHTVCLKPVHGLKMTPLFLHYSQTKNGLIWHIWKLY